MLKKFSFVLLAVAAMSIASCQKSEVDSTDVTGPVKITVTANADGFANETKTYLGEYEGVANTVLWGENEQMTIAVIGESLDVVNSTETSSFDGNSQATFEFTLTPSGSAPYIYSGIYPSSVVVTTNNDDASKFKVSLPQIQNALTNSYDPSAYIMVAQAEEFDEIQTSWMASYRRATALNVITLTGLNEAIEKVEITAPADQFLAGRRYIDLTTGESGEIYNSGSNVITVKYATPLQGNAINVWFTSWGQTIASGSNLTIKAYSANKSYTRTITAREGGIKFAEGALNKLSINMAADDVVVDDIENLEGEYLIASFVSNKWVLMTPTNGGSYYNSLNTTVVTAVESVTSYDFSNVSNITDLVWTVSSVEGGYSIKSNSTGKFVGLSSNGNNAHALDEAEGLDVSLNGKVATVNSKSFSSRALKYNSGSPRFAFYTSAQNNIYFIPVTGFDDPTPGDEVENESTIDDPYTPAEANALALRLGTNKLNDVYVSGIVTEVSINTQYGNATYYISADGTATDRFYIYRGKYLDGEVFTSEDQLKVGDQVIVCGTLVLYNGSTPEFEANSTLVSLTRESGDEGSNGWKLVTDASSLSAGDVIVFAAYNITYKASGVEYTDNKVMGAISNSLGTPVNVAFSSDGTSIPNMPTDAQQYTLGGSAGAWTIMNGEKYLTQGDKKITEGDEQHLWSISISNSEAIVTSTTADTYKLQYNPNSGNGRFATYSSSQKPIRIYRYE